MSKRRGIWLLACAMLFVAARAHAQDARLSVSVDSVFVGERFDLRVAIEYPSGGSVSFQEVPEGDPDEGPLMAFGDAEVFMANRLPPRLEGAVRTDSIVYEAATFVLDRAVIGPVIVELMANGDTSIVRSNTVSLPVRSVLPAGEAEPLPPGPPISFPSPLWVWVGLAAGAMVLGVILFWLWRRARKGGLTAKPRLAPYPEARNRLDTLSIPTAEDAVKPFYVALSELLRTYLSRTLCVGALELTTRELTDALASDERVPEFALKNIRGTLRVADLVKFADMRPDVEAHTTALEKASEAVELVEAIVHPPAEAASNENGVSKPEDGELMTENS